MNGMILELHPDGKVHGANMEPTWVLSAPDGPHEPYYQGVEYLDALCCAYLLHIQVRKFHLCLKP